MTTAFIFPGQGSQSTAMLAAYDGHPLVAEAIAEASSALDTNMKDVINDESALNLTENTQPAMLAVSVGVYRTIRTAALEPVVFAGHSLGEYTALVCAGVLDFKKALQLVRLRGLSMQKAVPLGAGAMAAVIGLGGEAVSTVCETLRNQGAQVWAANYNAPQQTVIAGLKDAVHNALPVLKEHGGKRSALLPVSVPSHCPPMRPVAEELKESITAAVISDPTTPVLQNASPDEIEADNAALTENLLMQLEKPVRWVETIEHLTAMGVDRFYECGPGKVLSGLGRRITTVGEHIALSDSAALDALS